MLKIKKTIQFILPVGSVFTFMMALRAPAFYYGSTESWSSISALALGILGLPYGYIAWLANPVLLISWISIPFKEPNFTTFSSLAGCLLCLSFLLHKEIVTNEAGGTKIIDRMGEGFWLWFTSLLLMFVYGLLCRPTKNFNTEEK